MTPTMLLLPPPREAPPVTTATLRLVRSPLRGVDGQLRLWCQDVPVGARLLDVLSPAHQWARIICSGRVLPDDEWDTYVIRPYDELTVFPQWGIGPELGAILITIAIGLAVSAASQALSYVLFPPDKPNRIQPEVDQPTESFEGIRTTVGPGPVVPVIYGRRRVGGHLISAQVIHAVTIIDQPLLPGVAKTITNVFGGTLAPNGTPFDEIVIESPGHGIPDGAHVDIGGVKGKTEANGGWFVRLIDGNYVGLLGSAGIDPRPWEGGGVIVLVSPTAPGSRRVDAVMTPPLFRMLLGISEGPIGGVLYNTIEINGQPIGNFPGTRIFQRLGTPDQTPIPEFGEFANTFADGRDIPTEPAGTAITYTTTEAVSAFVLNVVFNRGLYFLNTRSEKQENISTIGYRYRINPGGTWSDISFFDVAAARTATVRFGIRRQDLPLAVYDIELYWSHATYVDDTRAQYQATLESVTEIQGNTSAYPHTALFGIEGIAMDSLQGQLPPNVTAEFLGKVVRVSQFEQVLNWTENPAWCQMDLMTNTRYGNGIPDSQIHLPGFAAWAAYNDEVIQGEKRHTFNYVLDREQRTQPLWLDMAGGSRTLLLKSGNLWTPRPTRNTTPSQLLNWANVSNLKLTYSRDPEDTNVMEARFANEETNFTQDVLTWPILENWPPTVHKGSLNLVGVTKPSRVTRALQFELNRRNLELLSMECDCALDAIVLQPHDIFRFAHPLPGWGTSGRVQAGSTVGTVVLDNPVQFEAGKSYHLYLRFDFDQMDIKPVVNPGPGEAMVLTMAVPFEQQPDADVTLWAFGESSPVDTAVKLFRVVQVQRRSDTTVHLRAIAHIPSIYDEAVATPLPPITNLPNPAGIPPPLTTLIATEVMRIQASGASLPAVDLSWDVANLSAGYAPYGGALILRRTVVLSGQAGQAQAGVVEFGAIQDPTDANVNFVPLATVRGHVLDYDDYRIITGSTYIYRVVPLSGQGVPNNPGAREVVIALTGPTSPGFFPGTPQRLRLRGQAVGQTSFEGQDVHIEWDSVADSPLFSTTFFVVTYTIEVWAPGQEYLLRRTIVPAGAPNQTLQWTYSFQQNQEDQLRAGFGGARRDLYFVVYANANTGVSSVTPATLLVNNPPPDMSDILPTAKGLAGAGLVNWQQWVEPRDFAYYIIFVDTVTPPLAIFQGVGQIFQEIVIWDLPIGVPHYVYLLPFDTFGAGIPSQIATFTPSLTVDSVPPGTPTGLTLTTGTDLSDDGTVATWVQAEWDRNPESDVGGYEVHVFLGASTVPTVYNPGHDLTTARQRIRFPVPGNLTVRVKLLAFDKIHNASAFTTEATITTGADTVPPGAPTNLTAIGSLQRVHLLWTPPGDADYAYSEVWVASVNNRASASPLDVNGNIQKGAFSFTHDNLAANTTRYYWVRAVDTSGNVSAAFYPASATAGISGTAGVIDTTFISSLAADKIIAGTITALVGLGVGSFIQLNGTVPSINIFDENNTLRFQAGKLGALSTDWGLRLFGPAPGNNLMWNFTTGATEDGLQDAAVTAAKIRVGALQAEHLSTTTLFVRDEAQLGTAVINTGHIKNLAVNGQAHIQDASIIAAKIADANILTAHIQDGNITSAKIGTAAIQNAHIGDLQVTAAKIQNGNILNAHIADAQITTAKIGDLAVDTAKINDLAVNTLKLAGASVSTGKIVPNAVSVTLLSIPAGGVASVGAEEFAAALTFSQVVTGDTVLLFFTATSVVPDGSGSTVRLRDGSMSGTILNAMSDAIVGAANNASPFAIHAVHLVTGGTFFNKQYFVTFQRTVGSGTTSLADMYFTAILLQR